MVCDLHVAIEHKEICSGILHDGLAEMVDEKGNVGGLAILVRSWYLEGVTALV